jgi:hypothetical protein
VVFTAAPVDHHRLNPGERYHEGFGRAECLLNFTNCLDPILKVYPLQDSQLDHCLGEVGFHRRDLKSLGWQAEKIIERDVTCQVKSQHVIKKYHSQPQVMSLLVSHACFD